MSNLKMLKYVSLDAEASVFWNGHTTHGA